MSFTVKIEPRRVEDNAYETHTVYDIKVIDGEGSEGEEYLLGSHQGYENRHFAVDLAFRLFATPSKLAHHIGMSGGPFKPELASLRVYGADGLLDAEYPLRTEF